MTAGQWSALISVVASQAEVDRLDARIRREAPARWRADLLEALAVVAGAYGWVLRGTHRTSREALDAPK